MTTLPVEFSARMKDLLGAEYAEYESSFGEPSVRAFRVNTGQISLADFESLNR